MRKLNTNLHTCRQTLHGGHKRGMCVNMFLLVHAHVAIRDSAFWRHTRSLDDDGTCTMQCKLSVMHQMEWRRESITRGIHAHRRHDRPVLQSNCLVATRDGRGLEQQRHWFADLLRHLVRHCTCWQQLFGARGIVVLRNGKSWHDDDSGVGDVIMTGRAHLITDPSHVDKGMTCLTSTITCLSWMCEIELGTVCSYHYIN